MLLLLKAKTITELKILLEKMDDYNTSLEVQRADESADGDSATITNPDGILDHFINSFHV